MFSFGRRSARGCTGLMNRWRGCPGAPPEPLVQFSGTALRRSCWPPRRSGAYRPRDESRFAPSRAVPAPCRLVSALSRRPDRFVVCGWRLASDCDGDAQRAANPVGTVDRRSVSLDERPERVFWQPDLCGCSPSAQPSFLQVCLHDPEQLLTRSSGLSSSLFAHVCLSSPCFFAAADHSPAPAFVVRFPCRRAGGVAALSRRAPQRARSLLQALRVSLRNSAPRPGGRAVCSCCAPARSSQCLRFALSPAMLGKEFPGRCGAVGLVPALAAAWEGGS